MRTTFQVGPPNNQLICPLDAPQFRSVTHFVDQFCSGLQARDTLHLAICNTDQRPVDVGEPLAIKTALV